MGLQTETKEMNLLKRVLIANRAEIAIRIAKAAAALNIESVGVYAPVDALSLHTRFASQSHRIDSKDGNIGGPVLSYLDGVALVRIAKASGCDSVHPGYGFLSENAAFAALCRSEGITFIGPPPEVLSLFGDKIRARSLAQSLGIPVISGSEKALKSSNEAQNLAAALGYPVMLKASAGGGGRGMRIVEKSLDMADAYERSQSEAMEAFGDGSLFLEKIVHRPRHIEVQIIADECGHVVHLFERDCSIQLRNQKVVEVAPAPSLNQVLKEKIFNDAVKLVHAAGYVNTGTVEFLVTPETNEYYFMECNPRIQVEHTVTEQITGIDIVEMQFYLASGASLADMGFSDQQSIAPPRGYAVQARVVARGEGTLNAYKEPTGPGVRVDACGYLGYTFQPQFDPLIAKVIGSSNSSRTFHSAIDRTLGALNEFHISGLSTNLPQLRAILSHPTFRKGDARTPFLLENPDIMNASQASPETGALALLDHQSRIMGVSTRSINMTPVPATARSQLPELESKQGLISVACPMGGTVVAVNVREGDRITEDTTLIVVSAMKMEANITAPCAGLVTAMQPLNIGDNVAPEQVVALIKPSEERALQADSSKSENDTWTAILEETRTLQKLAEKRLSIGSDDPGVVRQRNRGKLTCRERIDLLLDSGTFREVGSVAGFASYDEEGRIAAFTPANHVGGWGKINGRTAVVCADDFTSRGGHADGAIGQKSGHLDSLSLELHAPSIRMLDGSSGGGSIAAMVPQQQKEGESSAKESKGAITAGRPRVEGTGGSFLPGHLGSSLYAEQLSKVPVINMLLGSVVGIGAAKAVLGHFSVMVRDISQLFVAGPPVVSHAMGYDISKEDLGGWHIHCRNGAVDNPADTEEEAMAIVKTFLSYLPSSVFEPPPVLPPNADDSPDRREEELFTLIPRKRTTTFDIRRAIRLMADADSFFEIGPLWGTDQVVGFLRFNGYPMGVVASDSRHANGGSLTADG